MLRALRRVQFGWARYLALALLAAAGSWTAVRVGADLSPVPRSARITEVLLNGVTIPALVVRSDSGSEPSVASLETPQGIVSPIARPAIPGARALWLQGPLRLIVEPGGLASADPAPGRAPVISETSGTGRADDPRPARILIGVLAALVSAGFWSILCRDLPDPEDVAVLERLGLTRGRALAEWRYLVWMMTVLGLGLASVAGIVVGAADLVGIDVFLLAAALLLHGLGGSVAIRTAPGLQSD